MFNIIPSGYRQVTITFAKWNLRWRNWLAQKIRTVCKKCQRNSFKWKSHFARNCLEYSTCLRLVSENKIDSRWKEWITKNKNNSLAESRCLGTVHFELHAGLAELGRRAIHNGSGCFRGALEESIQNAQETVRYLHHEPIVLSEGKICQQAKLNIDSLKLILTSAMSSKVWFRVSRRAQIAQSHHWKLQKKHEQLSMP